MTVSIYLYLGVIAVNTVILALLLVGLWIVANQRDRAIADREHLRSMCNGIGRPIDMRDMTTTENGPKYPDVIAQLTGMDSNGFFLVAEVSKCLRKQARVSPEEIAAFREEAMSGDYDHLLRTCMDWVTVE